MRRPKWLARIIHKFGGALAVSTFFDVAKDGFRGSHRKIQIAASSETNLLRAETVLCHLETKSKYAADFVNRWIIYIIVTDSKMRWGNFCDGAVFIRSGNHLPDNVLATYLYRWAVQICLYKRFKRVEAAIDDYRCKVLADRFQLRLMNVMGCEKKYLDYIYAKYTGE